MLVQPVLTTHLLCRPVSIADTMGPREKLQGLVRDRRGVLRFWAFLETAAHAKTQGLRRLLIFADGRRGSHGWSRFAVVHLCRARDHLLQLAFDVRFAYVLIFEHAVAIDGECGGDCSNAESLRHRAIEAAIAHLQPSHLI